MLTKNSGTTNLLKAFFDIWNLLSWFWVLLLKKNAHPISKTGKSNKNQLPLTVHRAVFANLAKMTRKIVNFLIWSHFQFSSCHGICIYVCSRRGKANVVNFHRLFTRTAMHGEYCSSHYESCMIPKDVPTGCFFYNPPELGKRQIFMLRQVTTLQCDNVSKLPWHAKIRNVCPLSES